MKKSEGPIGVFDSGLGGITVLAELLQLLPNENFIYFGDSINAPYGNKQYKDILKYTINICDFLSNASCKAVVVACNTATSLVIKELRNKYSFPIIGMEPAIKPVYRQKKDIVVMATPNTLQEKKFLDLVCQLEIDDKIIKLPALGLVNIVENQWQNKDKARTLIIDYFLRINMKNVGAIVLGCTHFVFFRDLIEEVVGCDIEIVDGNTGTAKQLKKILSENELLITRLQNSKVLFCNSDDSKISLAKKLLLQYKKN